MADITFAQTYGPQSGRFNSIQQNSTSSIEATSQKIWLGPGLNSYSQLTGEIFIPENADSVFSGRGRVFSLAVTNDRIFAGLGFTSTAGGEPENAALGYYQSIDDGTSWDFISFPTDDRPPTQCDASSIGPPCDIEFQYGDQTYIRTRISVPQQSQPFDVDFFENTLLSVNWASGLLRSIDNGQSWQRLTLPPSFGNELNPDKSYQWFSRTPEGETVNRYDPRFDNNLLGFGLLIDNNQTVWVGTAGGVNISKNALTAPPEQITWDRISFDPENSSGLMGNWVVKIRQQPETDRIWMTNWRADPDNQDQFGIVYTDNDGETFQQFLSGVKVNDIGFLQNAIYAAADDGLYISKNSGANWTRVEKIESPNTYIHKDARYFSLATTANKIWVGTSDGIASTTNHGETWQILRVDMPLHGGNVYQPDAPNTDTYAYPNPFSPIQHTNIRIKFSATPGEIPIVTIFDFGMNKVRTIPVNFSLAAGSYEVSWDGRNEKGRILSAGTYFYSIKSSSGSINGKILLLD